MQDAAGETRCAWQMLRLRLMKAVHERRLNEAELKRKDLERNLADAQNELVALADELGMEKEASAVMGAPSRPTHAPVPRARAARSCRAPVPRRAAACALLTSALDGARLHRRRRWQARICRADAG